MKTCDDALLFVAFVFLLFASVFHFAEHGSHWLFDDHWRPRTLVAPDGLHYPDGTEIHPLIQGLVKHGDYEIVGRTIVSLGLLPLGLAGLLVWARSLAEDRSSSRCWGCPLGNGVRRLTSRSRPASSWRNPRW
jgi:hypothetical protein